MTPKDIADNSWYFRNTLISTNYNNLKNGITATTKYLELFFENLLLGRSNALKNRYLHIDFESLNPEVSKSQNDTLKLNFEELALLKIIKDNPSITQKQLADKSGISLGTIKRRTVEMQQKGLIQRKNGKRNGEWKILTDTD
ncbi:MAG: winged helix-turn-helix transcriptional regulator [Eubacterium sp.]|nr:winged helix-turn-helix transcriptional regulator [Eubacterium sp.]